MPSRPPGLRARTAKVSNWDRRKSAAARGYGAEHRRIRKLVLIEEPTCRLCDAKGDVAATFIADHIKPLSEGGETVRSNYQGLCQACSDAKTARESAAARRARR